MAVVWTCCLTTILDHLDPNAVWGRWSISGRQRRAFEPDFCHQQLLGAAPSLSAHVRVGSVW